MRIEIFIIGLTAFFIYDTYLDGKYTKMIISWKKYYQMAFVGFLGLSVYFLLKHNPAKGKNMLLYANNMVKYMPISKSSVDMFSPIADLTSSYFDDSGVVKDLTSQLGGNLSERRILDSGKNTNKRSVSETKKKYVASQQQWKCGNCNNQLNAWFEVDHKIRLEHGGSNEVTNLVALCRECHGRKTSMENM